MQRIYKNTEMTSTESEKKAQNLTISSFGNPEKSAVRWTAGAKLPFTNSSLGELTI